MATVIDTVHSRSIAVDLTWERCQEQAMLAFRTSRATMARANWARALDIAERHFERGDPRLAASLNNHAFALMRQNQLHQAKASFLRAEAAWEDSWRWIPWMTPSTGQGEAEAEPYDRETLDAFYALIRQGQAITETLSRENRLPEVEGDDWKAVKPRRMTDIRRLFSAIFLMPTARTRRGVSIASHHVNRADVKLLARLMR
ncbi:MAG: tetratricopeptide repeat protein [Geminicoccaceae bacterium]